MAKDVKFRNANHFLAANSLDTQGTMLFQISNIHKK